MKKILTLVFSLILLLPLQAQAAPAKYVYDPLHTQIIFSVSHLGFSFSHGKFNKFSGGFTLDEEKPETSAAEITIDMDGLDMDSDKWEEHLKGPDFFNAARFPSMFFKSTKVVKTGEKTADMTGDLTLLGVTKPVTLQVTLNKAGTFPMDKSYKAGFSLTGTLKRSDFGMSYSLPMIGDEVKLDIQVEGIRQDFEKINK